MFERWLVHPNTIVTCDLHHQNYSVGGARTFMAIDPRNRRRYWFWISGLVEQSRGWLLTNPDRRTITQGALSNLRSLHSRAAGFARGLTPSGSVGVVELTKTAEAIGKNGWLAQIFGKLKIRKMHNLEWSDSERWQKLSFELADHGFSCSVLIWTRRKRPLLLVRAREWKSRRGKIKDLSKLWKRLENYAARSGGKNRDGVIENLCASRKRRPIIDGGNSHFVDTETREKYLADKGIEFIGVGRFGAERKARGAARALCRAEIKNLSRTSRRFSSRFRRKWTASRAVAYMGAILPGISSRWFITASNTLNADSGGNLDFMFRVLKIELHRNVRYFR